MAHEIDWNTAVVSGGALTVRLRAYQEDAAASREWEQAFNALASSPLPGVPFAPSDPWGRIYVGSGVIQVEPVPQRSVDNLRAQLEAAVRAADERMDQVRAERAREAARRSEQEQREAARDQELSERFRQFGNQE